MAKQTIKLSEVIGLLDKGYVRYKKQNDELAEEDRKGSIQEYYDLKGTDVQKLFQHPELKGKKTKRPNPFVIEDDINETSDKEENVTEETSTSMENEVKDISEETNTEEETMDFEEEEEKEEKSTFFN